MNEKTLRKMIYVMATRLTVRDARWLSYRNKTGRINEYKKDKYKKNETLVSDEVKKKFVEEILKQINRLSKYGPVSFKYEFGKEALEIGAPWNDYLRYVFEELPSLPSGKCYALPSGTILKIHKEGNVIKLDRASGWIESGM